MVCCAALLLACAGAAAGGTQASVQVTATVLKHARINIIAAPATLVISESDVARGYLDVPVPTEILIRSNNPDGYMLQFAADGGLVRRMSIGGLADEIELDGAGTVVVRGQPAGISTERLTLRFRLLLSQQAHAGTYVWPMRLSVLAL